MKGIVYRSTGSWYQVKDEQGRFWQARVKGVLKIDDITSTNPVAVGDLVEMDEEDSGDAGNAMITAIHTRKNYINRQSPRAKHQHHIIAANLDQSMLVATLREPRTSQGFIDRFLLACEMYHVPAILILNKSDLNRKKEEDKVQEWREMYSPLGYQVLLTSVKTGKGIDELNGYLAGKTTLMSGHSGVGKSSLLNVIVPGLELKTRDVSGWSGKGMHTTTFAEMFDLPGGGRVIDTPGMREFGLVDLPRQEVSHYFPEMRAVLNQCQFNNCLHMNEPGCAVKQSVLDGKILEERYISYCTILDSIEDKKY